MNNTNQQPPRPFVTKVWGFIRFCFWPFPGYESSRAKSERKELERRQATFDLEDRIMEARIKAQDRLVDWCYKAGEKVPIGFTFEYLGRLVVVKCLNIDFNDLHPEAVFECEYADDTGVIHEKVFRASELLALLGITVEEPETESKP